MAFRLSAHPYGAEAEQALAAAVARQKAARQDPLAPVTIVAPSPLSGYHIRRSLGRRAGGIVNVQVKPLQALLELIGSAALTNAGRRPLPDAYRAETIRAVAEAGAPVFGDVPIEGPVLHSLRQRFVEFDDCDAAQLAAIAAAGGLAQYLVGRYEAYLERIGGFYTVRDLARSATAALAQRSAALRDIGAVIVYLPSELSAAQRDFLRALAAQTEVEVLLGLTGDVEAVDQQTLQSWGLPAPTTAMPVPTAQQIVQSPDAEEEVRAAIRAIAAGLAAAEPTPLHRTAILYREAEPYARICAEQLDAAGLVWNGRSAQTLRQTVAGRTLDGLLGLLADSAVSWANAAAPWLSAAPIRGADGSPAPTARWNQLARRANLRRANLRQGGREWVERLERYRAVCQSDLARLQRSVDEERPGRLPWVEAELGQVEELLEFTAQLIAFAQETPAAGRWSAYAERLRGELERLLGGRSAFAAQLTAEADAELARWDDVQALLTELSWLDDLEAATPERFVAAARRGLERAVGRRGGFGDGVYVGPLHSAVGLRWEVVYIVGAAERSLPQTRSEEPLLSDQLRARASLPGAADHLRRERRDYLTALHAAEQRVLSYPRADLRAQWARLPGRWLIESASALNGGERIYASKIEQAPREVVQATPSFEGAVRAAPTPADLQEFDLQSVRASRRPREHYLAAADAALGRGYALHAERRRGWQTRWDGLIVEGAARAAAQPHSASALQDWATCPYRYFLGRVLRIEEHDEPRDDLQITALDKGALVHEILDQFFQQAEQPRPGERWSAGERERLAAIAAARLETAQAQGLTGRELLWQRDRRRILDDLERLLDEDNDHRARHSVRQAASELVFGVLPDGVVRVGLRLDDGSVLPLRGIIDRVDRAVAEAGGQPLVIDYKTGGEYPKAKELAADPLVGGRSLQLPIYAHAARQVYGLEADAAVQSAYWYITERGKFQYNAVEWNRENTDRFERAINLIVNHVRAGRFPANPGGEHRDARGEHCAFCSFDAICPVDRRRRWEQIQLDPQLADYVGLTEGEVEGASSG